MSITSTAMRPRMGKIAQAVTYSGRSRSRLYQLSAEYPGLFRKDGASTLVDFDILDRILDALPPAETKPTVKATPALQGVNK
jgi:hypothetical protein